MKLRTKEEVIATLKVAFEDTLPTEALDAFPSLPWGESLLDNRDLNRLLLYLTHDEAIDIFGDNLAARWREWHEVRPWNEQTIMEHICSSLEFAFEKALGQRGIISSLMHGVMRMWMWVIQDEELTKGEPYYDDYGLAYLHRIRNRYFPEMKVWE